MIKPELYELFVSLPDSDRALLADSFATGCWLHQQGKIKAAEKLIREVLYKVESTLLVERGELITEVFEMLPGNEQQLANCVPHRREFSSLF